MLRYPNWWILSIRVIQVFNNLQVACLIMFSWNVSFHWILLLWYVIIITIGPIIRFISLAFELSSSCWIVVIERGYCCYISLNSKYLTIYLTDRLLFTCTISSARWKSLSPIQYITLNCPCYLLNICPLVHAYPWTIRIIIIIFLLK